MKKFEEIVNLYAEGDTEGCINLFRSLEFTEQDECMAYFDSSLHYEMLDYEDQESYNKFTRILKEAQDIQISEIVAASLVRKFTYTKPQQLIPRLEQRVSDAWESDDLRLWNKLRMELEAELRGEIDTYKFALCKICNENPPVTNVHKIAAEALNNHKNGKDN